MRTGAVTTLEDPPLVLAPSERRFRDRRQAGRRLAARLEPLRETEPVILGMPRGGVPVAAEVARELDAPLDVVLVRKIGAPQNPEYALGAVAENGVRLLRPDLQRLGISDAELEQVSSRGDRELSEQIRRYRGAHPPLELRGRTAIIVDDGLATGLSALAAIRSVRMRGAARIILAVPVAAPKAAAALSAEADEVVSVEMPEDLWAVGLWYEDFRPTSDEEVASLLAELRPSAGLPKPRAGTHKSQTHAERDVMISLPGEGSLPGDLLVPEDARATVVFAHGSGSSRLSPRNRTVAQALVAAGYAALLFDLLTPAEELDRRNVFDIEMLASRLLTASRWLERQPDLGHLPLAFFGASTGAAAALTAAGELGERASAVISRGGRPDLARNLPAVRAPTLLIVGGEDPEVLELNRIAQRRLRCPSELAVIPGATHLFEEPGALEEVTRLAIEWLRRQLADDYQKVAAGR